MFQVSEIPTVKGLDESATYHQLAFLYMGRKSKKIPGESHARPDTALNKSGRLLAARNDL